MIRITDHISIDEDELEERFIRASGPGGQNVNKLNTAVQLRFDVRHSPALRDDVRARLDAPRRPAPDQRRCSGHHRAASPHPGAQPPGRARSPDRADPSRCRRAQAAATDQAHEGIEGTSLARQEAALDHQGPAARQAGVGLAWGISASGLAGCSPLPSRDLFTGAASDERAHGQAGQHELLERADRAARPAARAPQDRRAGGAALRAAAREQRAGPDALVPAPRDHRHGAVDAVDLPAGNPARQPLRPAEIPGRADPVHRRGPRPHHARRRQARLGSGRRASTCRASATASSCSTSTTIRRRPRSFLAVEPNLFAATSVDRGCGFDQLEQSPDYKRPARASKKESDRWPKSNARASASGARSRRRPTKSSSAAGGNFWNGRRPARSW